MKYICILIASILGQPCAAQLTHSSRPPNYMAVGAYSLNFTDVFSFTTNQASLARIKNRSVGVYSERKYMLNELKRISATIAFPLRHGGAGVTADYFGYTGYNESHAGIAYGRVLGEKIDFGAQFNYHYFSVAGYGSDRAMNFETGVIIHLTNQLHVGCHIYNPVGGKFGKSKDEKTASVYSFGTGYEASEKLFITATLTKEENHPINVNASVQYAPVKQVFIRAGLNSATAGYFAGTGVAWNVFRLDVAANWHPQAGLTPCVLLVFSFTPGKARQE